MKLTDIKGIGPKLGAELAADGWTVSYIATAAPDLLAVYDGVSKRTAEAIIADARRLINEQELKNSAVVMPPMPPPPPAVRSARVQRIWESMQ